jgi:mannosyltransferase OCH1-like enzyme
MAMTMRRKLIALYICILIILILLLTGYYTARYVLRRRSPLQMVYETDVAQFTNATWARRRIPRLIHQTWSSLDVPLRWNASYHSVIGLNAGEFVHHLWIDEEMHAFVQKYEPEFYKNTYITYQYEIQRADSFRYVVLYHLGGIYIDMDNGCNRPFKDLLATLEALDPESSRLAAFPLDVAYGIDIDFLISTPGHPLFKQLISRLHLFHHYYLLHFYTIVLSTGPLYATIQERLFNSSSQEQAVRVLDYAVSHPIFTHNVGGKSWLARDAPITFYIDSNSDLIFRYCKIFSVFLIFLVLLMWCRSQRSYFRTVLARR